MLSTCSDCKETKPYSEFSIRHSGKPQAKCKLCQRIYSKKHYQLNKVEHNKRRYANRKHNRGTHIEFINNLKRAPCSDCGNVFHPVCMDFDHVRGIKKFNISVGVRRNLSIPKLMEEIDKCEIVCSNCHRLRTLTRLMESKMEF